MGIECKALNSVCIAWLKDGGCSYHWLHEMCVLRPRCRENKKEDIYSRDIVTFGHSLVLQRVKMKRVLKSRSSNFECIIYERPFSVFLWSHVIDLSLAKRKMPADTFSESLMQWTYPDLVISCVGPWFHH